MSCELVIHKNINNYAHVDEEKDRRGVYKKGYIVAVRANPNNIHSDKEKLNFTFVRVTDADVAELESYSKEWEMYIDYELVGSDTSIDGYRYRIFSTNPGVSFRGAITLTKAQKYLDNWNVDIFSTAQNEIVVDVTVFDMLKSKGFWDRPEGLTGMTASEVSYNESTGEHIIDVDWSNFLPNVEHREGVAQEMQSRILQRGGTVIDYDLQAETGRFSMYRNDVLTWFRDDVYSQLRKQFIHYRRQFYIEPSLVDTIENSFVTNGTPMEVTKSQLATYVKSMLDKVDA